MIPLRLDRFELAIFAGLAVALLFTLFAPASWLTLSRWNPSRRLQRGRRARAGLELDELTSSLLQLSRRVQASVARTRRFSENSAHQLRTPLSRLRMRLELLTQRGDLDADATETLRAALDQIDQLSRSVSALLDLARVEHGLVASERVRVDLPELLAGVREFFATLAEDQGIEFSCRAECRASVSGNLEWLRQLFANLVDNAIKYTPRGGSVAIELRDDAAGSWVSVRDSGPGISHSEQRHVFERFHRSPGTNATPGMGIGLTLAREIAVAHGGRLELESAPGHGSLFRVFLPRAEL